MNKDCGVAVADEERRFLLLQKKMDYITRIEKKRTHPFV
jgi:hypothetical protein